MSISFGKGETLYFFGAFDDVCTVVLDGIYDKEPPVSQGEKILYYYF